MKNKFQRIFAVALFAVTIFANGSTLYLSAGLPIDAYAASSYKTEKANATKKMWRIIQKFADPDYYRNEYRYTQAKRNNVGGLEGKKYERIAKAARKQTENCSSDYEKMEKLCKYIAKRTYCDLPYLYEEADSTNTAAYDVWKGKRAVCQGFSNLYWMMMDAVGVPCMIVYADRHVYNAAYDKESGRWIFVDVTWCCNNHFDGDGKWMKGDYDGQYFDMSLEFMLTLDHHEIFAAYGVLRDGIYYEMVCGELGGAGKRRYYDRDTWQWTVVGPKGQSGGGKIASKIGGIVVVQ